MDKKFPYSSVFESHVSYGGLFSESPFYSQASLEGLRPLIPNWEANTAQNIDLLAFAANACAIGIANKNDDMIEPEAGVETLGLWKSKMVNDGHDRSKIVGHLITAGLSSENDSILISAQDAIASKQPFNVSVGGVVYRLADRDLASNLEDSSDPESKFYKKISLSMELGFPSFDIALGSNNFYEAEIVRNQTQVKELQKFLRIYGGNGKTKDGQNIYRVINKNHLPLAVALTPIPAGTMPQGAITNSTQQISKNTTISLFAENNSDKNKKQSVTNINQPMDPKFFEELKATLLANQVKEEAVASLSKQFADQIQEFSKEHSAKVSEANAAKASAEKEAAELKLSVAAQAKELADTKAALEKIQAQATEKEAAELFSARMDEFNNEFELDDEDRAALAGEIKNLDASAESFAAFKKKMGKLMDSKCKTKKACAEKEAKAALDIAVAAKLTELAKASSKNKLSDKELAEKLLEQVQAKASDQNPLPNGSENTSTTQTLKEKFAAAFDKKNITVTL